VTARKTIERSVRGSLANQRACSMIWAMPVELSSAPL
jgi:hypothetical protein